MKTEFWIVTAVAVIAIAFGITLDIHNAQKIERLTVQRDSITELHTRAMLEWSALQNTMQVQVRRATEAYARGSRDFDTVFEAGMQFGAYLERYTQNMSNRGEHWDVILDEERAP